MMEYLKNLMHNNGLDPTLEISLIAHNEMLIKQYPWIEKYIKISHLHSLSYWEGLKKINHMDSGGFNHGDLSGLYVMFQNDPRYSSTRLLGWKNLFEVALSFINSSDASKENVIIDFLAGSGTLSKRLKQLSIIQQQLPMVLGIDVSYKMCEHAFNLGEVVLWGSHECHLFKEESADVAIAAYGFHHVPSIERQSFIKNMQKVLKQDGVCLIHDFEENSTTARWYSEIIHQYRTCGHPYQHITVKELILLLNPHFSNVEVRAVYDPFVLEGNPEQDETSLKREFFGYLLSLFNLKKLLPMQVSFEELKYYNDSSFWKNIENILTPYFVLSQRELKELEYNRLDTKISNFREISVPLNDNLCVQKLPTGNLCLIAPRVALVGIGCNYN